MKALIKNFTSYYKNGKDITEELNIVFSLSDNDFFGLDLILEVERMINPDIFYVNTITKIYTRRIEERRYKIYWIENNYVFMTALLEITK